MTEFRFTYIDKSGKRNSLTFPSSEAFKEWLDKVPESSYAGSRIYKVESREVSNWEVIALKEFEPQ